MNLNKFPQLSEKNEQNNTNRLPFIKRVPQMKKIFHYSNSFLSSYPKEIPNKIYPKNSRVISYGSFGINIHTKLYRVNDYLNQSKKETNPFRSSFIFQKTRNINKNNEKNIEENMDKYKADTGLTDSRFFQPKLGYSVINSSVPMDKALDLNELHKNFNKKNFTKSQSMGDYKEKIAKINIENNNNEYVSKNLNYYHNINLLKNSRYFSRTKYITRPKNKLKELNNRHMNKSCSTKNLSIDNTRTSTAVKKTINDIRVEQLLNKQKNLDESDKKIIIEDNAKKTSDMAIGTDIDKNQVKTNPLFYDLIPLMLQHIKQKQKKEENNKDSSLIYNKINSIYNNNLKEKERYTAVKTKVGDFLFENPIIKYLFLEKTLNNLKHRVKFIDIKNQEQLEKNVLKVISEEYMNLKEKKFSYDINDFITYGYEFDPEFFVKSQNKFSKIDIQKYLNENKEKIDRSVQKNYSSKFSGGFFTTNKSEVKNNDKTVKSIKEKSKEIKSSSEGFLSKMIMQKRAQYKIRKFEGLKIKDREKSNQNDSNKMPNISNLILKESENNNFPSKRNKDENNYNFSELTSQDIKLQQSLEAETEKWNIPHPMFENDHINSNQPIIQDGVLSSLNKSPFDEDKYNIKKIPSKREKETKVNLNVNKKDLYFSKVTSVISTRQPKKITKVKISRPKVKSISIKKFKKKKNKHQKSKSPLVDKDNNNDQVNNDNQENKDEKREITNYEEYQKYKEEMIIKINKDKEIKEKIINEIKKEEEEEKNIINNAMEQVSQMKNSSSYQKEDQTFTNYMEKYKIKGEKDIPDIEEKKNISQIKEKKKEEEKIEEKKEENEEKENEIEEEDEAISDYSDSSSFYKNVESVDLSEELINKGEIMNKKWMENSPRFKNKIIDLSKFRRYGISATSPEMFENLSKNERITKLSGRIKYIYDRLKIKRREKKKIKKKKHKYFNFNNVDLSKLHEIEKKKNLYLLRLKEDIKYKIQEGKYHLIEIDNFKNFENAMNRFKLKDTLDPKKVKIYTNLVLKYFEYYRSELDRKEKVKTEEDRINRFLRDLNQDVYDTIPTLKKIQGRFCHSIDYFQELQKLSELHGFLM